MTLLGRYYERYADHAVAVARQVVYIVTGKMPEPLSTGGASRSSAAERRGTRTLRQPVDA